MTSYRRIYEQHYGPIPKDSNGRSFEIHHIDGNRRNNNISNLVCLTIEEHYEVHKFQGDWGACYKIAKRMTLIQEELSKISKNLALLRIKAGIHNFQDPCFQRKYNKIRVENGSHNFQKKEVKEKVARNKIFNKNKTIEGTHPFQNQKQVTCPHCSKTGANGIMHRFHFDKCKHKNN